MPLTLGSGFVTGFLGAWGRGGIRRERLLATAPSPRCCAARRS